MDLRLSTRLSHINKTLRKLFTPRMLVLSLIILIIVVVFVAPYLWMIGSTFKPRSELFASIFPFTWRTFIPQNPTLENFVTLFEEYEFGTALRNSLTVSLTAVVLSLIVNSMVAFVLAWLKFPGRKLLFGLILVPMAIVFEARLVPLFLISQKLGLDNTLFGVIAPWISAPFIIFLLHQHFKGLHEELYDAAIIDGCSHFRIYWSVMLPNIIPGLISAAIIKFIGAWDSYIWPLITLHDKEKQLITLSLARMFTDDHIRWEVLFAGSFVSTIPVIILFIFLQRYYVSGYTRSGLKG